MSPKPNLVDESPISEFLGKMIDAHKRRLKAASTEGKRAIEREMEEYLRRYFSRSAHDAAADARAPAVPRATRRDTLGHKRRRLGMVDRKMLAAGPDGD